jgi:hypothetical protein
VGNSDIVGNSTISDMVGPGILTLLLNHAETLMWTSALQSQFLWLESEFRIFGNDGVMHMPMPARNAAMLFRSSSWVGNSVGSSDIVGNSDVW